MPKFSEKDKILQISAYPNAVCYTAYDRGPSIATVVKVTQKMYRLDFSGEMHDVRIEDVERDFVYHTEERYNELLNIWHDMRTMWSKLYKKQIDLHREDRQNAQKDKEH